MAQVGNELWEDSEWLYPLFYSYASLDSAVHTLGFNSWSKLVDDLELSDPKSKFAKKRDLDNLFIAINAKTTVGRKGTDAAARPGVSEDDRRRLSRVEFLGALVHVAILRYIRSGVLSDVSEAMHTLLEHMQRRVRAEMCVNPDKFRAEHCYTRGVTVELAEREPLLRLLFEQLSSLGSDLRTGAASLVSLEEWEALMKALDFVGKDLSQRDVVQTFLWSRMVVVNGRTERGFLKESCLPFEGFMEALCRTSVLKALPTDDEVGASGCGTVGEYMEMIKAEDEARYEEMLITRATPWGVEQTLQPTGRCVAQLLDLIAHTMARDIDLEVSEGERPVLTAKQVARWFSEQPCLKSKAKA